MWKLLFFVVAVYVAYKLFANDFFRRKKDLERKEKEETERMAASGEMVKDPECGAYVAVDGSISVRDGDKVYHFCSYDCRDKFLKRLEAGGMVLPGREDKD